MKKTRHSRGQKANMQGSKQHILPEWVAEETKSNQIMSRQSFDTFGLPNKAWTNGNRADT